MGFGVAQGILVGFLGQYQQGVVTNITNTIAGTPGAQPTQYINTSVQAISGTASFTQFTSLLRV